MTSTGISHFPAPPLRFDYLDPHQNTHHVHSARKLEKPRRSTLHRRRTSARYSSTYSSSDPTTTNSHRREVYIVRDSSSSHPRPRSPSFASCSFFGIPFKNMQRSSVLTAHSSPLSSNHPGRNGHNTKRNAKVKATRGVGNPRPTSPQFRVGAGSNAKKRTSYYVRPHSVVHNLRSVPLSEANSRLAHRHSKLSASSPPSTLASQSNQWDFESGHDREMVRDYERILRRKKIAILSRRFGENVPPDLVFPVSASASVNLGMQMHLLDPFLSESPTTPNTTTNTDALSEFQSQSISAPPSPPAPIVVSPAPVVIGTPPFYACESTICKPSPESPSSLHSLPEETLCTGTVIDASEGVNSIIPPLPSSAALLEQYHQRQQQALSPTLKEKEQKDRRRKTSLRIQSKDLELSRYFREAEIRKGRENETETVAAVLEVEGREEIEETRRSIELQPQEEAEKLYPPSLESPSLPYYEANVGGRWPTSQIHSTQQEHKRNHRVSPTFVIGDSGEVYVRFDYSTMPPPAPMSTASITKSEYGPDNSSSSEVEEKGVKSLNKSHRMSKSVDKIGMGRGVSKTEVVTEVGGVTRHSFPASGPLGSGHRKEREWSGEWNLGDIGDVMSALRGLKAQ